MTHQLNGYFITCFRKLITDKEYIMSGEIPSQRTFGWYLDKDDAFGSILNNSCDMHEACYISAVVEELHQGIHPINMPDKRWWFKWEFDSNHEEGGQWLTCDPPEWAKGICNFSVG